MQLEEIRTLVKTAYAALAGGEGDQDSAIGTLEIALNLWDKVDEEKYCCTQCGKPIASEVIDEAAFHEHNAKVRARLKALGEK